MFYSPEGAFSSGNASALGLVLGASKPRDRTRYYAELEYLAYRSGHSDFKVAPTIGVGVWTEGNWSRGVQMTIAYPIFWLFPYYRWSGGANAQNKSQELGFMLKFPIMSY